MVNKIRNQLKNLVAINSAIAESGEEIQMIQKEMNIHGHDQKYVSALNDLKQKVTYYRYQKVRICTELYDKNEALEDEQEKRLMKYRYIRGYRWEDIADKMGYSVRQVFNIHQKALLSLAIKLDLFKYNASQSPNYWLSEALIQVDFSLMPGIISEFI